MQTMTAQTAEARRYDTMLLLSTYGRDTGRREINFLTYRCDGDRIILAASNDRNQYKPDWYLNLKEEPLVQVEFEGRRVHARASIATGRERVRLWPLAEEISVANEDQIPRHTSIVTLTQI